MMLSRSLLGPCLPPLQLYVYHFCGHYVFLPMFFNKALCNWFFPKRWKLPAKALEEVSTSVRVIARLLWTVHLDFSQEVGAAWLLAKQDASSGPGNNVHRSGPGLLLFLLLPPPLQHYSNFVTKCKQQCNLCLIDIVLACRLGTAPIQH